MDRRIWHHPILEFKRGRKVKFYFEDYDVEAYEGESIAAALYAAGVNVFSWSTKLSRPRGVFCMIGKCSSCLMSVDGIPNTRTCIEPVREGITVKRQHSIPSIPEAYYEEEVKKEESLNADVLVIGAGPAGLSAALTVAEYGLNVVLVDEHHKIGEQLVKQTHKFFGSKEFFGGLRGFQIAEIFSRKVLENQNIKVMLNNII